MVYRTIKITWQPKSQGQWRIFSAARAEAGRLWSDLVERHFRARRAHWKWPTKSRWFKWAKGRYPNLHSQSSQQIITDFCEAVSSARSLRKRGADVRYPWRKPRYHSVIYTNQGARIRDGCLLLPNGCAGTLQIKLPIDILGRLMEVQLDFDEIRLICEVEDGIRTPGPIIGVDLGVNTLIAATDGKRAVLGS